MGVRPEKIDDVTGIWRNVHQGVLELRDNGDFVLISPITKPDSGKYTLQNGVIAFAGGTLCPPGDASYAVGVVRSQRMMLSSDGDRCELRRRVLVSDPWVYIPRGST